MSQYIDDNENELDLMELIHVVMKNLVMIILVGIIAGVGGYTITEVCIDEVYSSSAKMIVNTRYDLNTTVTNDQISTAKSLVDTYSIIIRSRTVLESAMENLNINSSYEAFASKISVASVNGTEVMGITATDTDPQVAYDIVMEIANIAPDIIMNTVEAGSVKTIEYPVVATDPISPNKTMNGIICTMLGMIIVVTIVLLRFILDDRFKNIADIEKHLNLPILGIIPDINSCSDAKKGDYK